MRQSLLKTDVNGDATDSDESAEVVVLAADGVRVTGTAVESDNTERAASKADENVQTVEYYAEKREESEGRGRTSVLGAIATQLGARVALADWRLRWCGRRGGLRRLRGGIGDSKDCH